MIDNLHSLLTGFFGMVFRGKWQGTTPVALKAIKKEQASLEELLEEAAVLKKLNHQNVVRFFLFFFLFIFLSAGSMDCLITKCMESFWLLSSCPMAVWKVSSKAL